MNIKRVFVFVFIVVALISCGLESGKWRVNGEMEDMQAGEMWIYCLADGVSHHDTIHVEGNSFTYTGTIGDEVVPYMLVYPNATEHVIFAESGEILEYSVVAHDLKNYKVTGTKENEIMNEFREKTAEIPDTKGLQKVAKEFIEKYADSPVGTYLLDRYFVQELKGTDTKEISELMKKLEKAQPESDYVKNIRGKLNLMKKCGKGAALPDITFTTKSDEKINLRDIKNQRVMLCYWATWMDNSVYILDRIKDFKKKYAEKNDIRVIVVSLDGSKNSWNEFLQSDSISLTHCCDGLSWESPSVKKLGIPSVPYYILTDKNKKITACGSNLDALQDGLEPTTP